MVSHWQCFHKMASHFFPPKVQTFTLKKNKTNIFNTINQTTQGVVMSQNDAIRLLEDRDKEKHQKDESGNGSGVIKMSSTLQLMVKCVIFGIFWRIFYCSLPPLSCHFNVVAWTHFLLVYLKTQAVTLIMKHKVMQLDCPHEASIEIWQSKMSANWKKNLCSVSILLQIRSI